ncbi:hypothetical protein GCM10023107_03950 [Actinoplanes octamycinicus]|nr:hypothetical protein Aoc01nite_91690 [Actinoplanes octamycinicus]
MLSFGVREWAATPTHPGAHLVAAPAPSPGAPTPPALSPGSAPGPALSLGSTAGPAPSLGPAAVPPLSLDELPAWCRRVADALDADAALSRADLERALLATELAFASSTLGHAARWPHTTGFPDRDAITVLRAIQEQFRHDTPPAVYEPAWTPMLDAEDRAIWDRLDTRFGVRLSTSPRRWPGSTEPDPSVTFDLSSIIAAPAWSQQPGPPPAAVPTPVPPPAATTARTAATVPAAVPPPAAATAPTAASPPTALPAPTAVAAAVPVPAAAALSARIDALNAMALLAFAEAVPDGGRLAVLDWQHQSYWFRPDLQVRRGDPWPLSVFPDGDYYIFLTEDLTAGTFGHPWEQTLCVFGEPLMTTLVPLLTGWLPIIRDHR